jgi:IclR family KDG regulon transcriptional repressor
MEDRDSMYLVKPVDRALQVLHCLAEEGRELTLTDLSCRVRIPKTTVYRYLSTLRKWGLVAHDPKTDLYRLGSYLHVLAQRVGKAPGLREAALPVLRQLRDRFNETTNLAELEGREVIYVEIVESRRSLRTQATVGSRDPAYSTAVGKALLAALPDAIREDHLPGTLRPRTPHTHRSRESLLADLTRIRARGFAMERGENEEGAACIAAAVKGRAGVVAAISVSAPEGRVSTALEQEIAAAVVQAADDISRRLALGEPNLRPSRQTGAKG